MRFVKDEARHMMSQKTSNLRQSLDGQELRGYGGIQLVGAKVQVREGRKRAHCGWHSGYQRVVADFQKAVIVHDNQEAEAPCSGSSRYYLPTCQLPRTHRSALIVLIVEGIVPDKLFHDTSRYVSFVIGISAAVEPVKLHPANSKWLHATKNGSLKCNQTTKPSNLNKQLLNN